MKSLPNSSGDNIALLLKQADVIARFYQDRLIGVEDTKDNNNFLKAGVSQEQSRGERYDRLQVITQVAQLILTGLIKTQENIQPYLGDVNLPMDLYELKPQSESKVQRSSHALRSFEHILSTTPSHMPTTLSNKSKKRQAGTDKTRSEEGDMLRKSAAKGTVRSKTTNQRSKKQKTEKVKEKVSVRTSGSRRRGGVAVNYRDTGDSEDEEEMEEIEELLSSQSQPQSRRSSSSSTSSTSAISAAPLFRQSIHSPLFANRRSSVELEDDDIDDVEMSVSGKSRRSSGSSRRKSSDTYGTDDDESYDEELSPAKKLKSERASKSNKTVQNKTRKQTKVSKSRK